MGENTPINKIAGKPLRLKFIVCKVLQREAYYCAARTSNLVDIYLLPQGLHNEPDKLRAELQSLVSETCDVQGRKYDAIIFGYGLCSNGTVGLSAEIPLVIPRGHDCITLLLGSKEKYQEYFDSHRGIYWYSPGWIENNDQPSEERREKTLQAYIDQYGLDNAQYLMDMEEGWMKEYSWASYVGWDFLDEKIDNHYADYTKKCADYLDWDFDRIQGSSSLVQRMVDGDWNEEDFVVAKPGQTTIQDITSGKIIDAE